MTLLEVTDLTVEYSSGGYKVRPLDDFTLHVDKRELTVLLGASGCGKSTLLSAIAGILRPVSGSIRVGGGEVVGLGNRALTRYRQTSVGVVFQAFNLIPSLSARENIEIICRTAGQSRTAARARRAASRGDGPGRPNESSTWIDVRRTATARCHSTCARSRSPGYPGG